MRFILEIIERINERVGKDYPILCRINGDDFTIGGITIEDSQRQVQKLKEAGVAAVDLSQRIPVTFPGRNLISGRGYSSVPNRIPRGSFLYISDAVKEAVPGIPIIASGRIGDPLLAEKIIEDGRADLVAFGRSLLADPELPNKAAEGRLDDIRPCLACSRNCIGGVPIFNSVGRACAVNPTLGMKENLGIKPSERMKSVLVIGGGPAGMETANMAALRGHKVTLYEEDEELGGQTLLASKPPNKSELHNFLVYLETQMRKLKVNTVLGKRFTPEMADELKPDVIIVATGAKPIIPEIPGVNGKNVVTAFDILSGKAKAGRNIVMVGGGLVGVETALFLADPPMFKVTIVEMLDDIAIDEVRIARGFLLQAVKNRGIWTRTNTKVERITQDNVVVSSNGSKATLAADTVVLAVGTEPRNELVEALQGKAPEVYAVGDCVNPRRVGEAVHEGYNCGCYF